MSIIATSKDQAMTVRFPPGMLEELEKRARSQGRSRNTEIIKRLSESLEAEEAQEKEKAA